MIAALPWKVYFAAKGLARHWRDIERFRTADPLVARRAIGARLRELLRHFAARGDALPEWEAAARTESVDEFWEQWPALPVLTRQDLVTRFSPEKLQRAGATGTVGATGGATGEPVRFLHDRSMREATTALRLFGRMRLGWRPGQAQICLWGSERDIGGERAPGRRLSALLRNEWLVDGFRADERTVDRVLRLIEAHGECAVYGYTSLLEFLARAVLDRGLPTPIPGVAVAWNGGEMLHPEQSELFQRAFGVPILDFYGCRELSALACQPRRGEPLEVLRPQLFLEILDDRGQPAPPGEVGRLVWTSTVCRGTPFVRYDIGDLGAHRGEDADESGVRSIAELHGRDAGTIGLDRGGVLSSIFWSHLLKEFPEVRRFQVGVHTGAEIELRLVGAGFTREREERVRAALRGVLGERPVAIRWMEALPRTAQGKLIQVVRET